MNSFEPYKRLIKVAFSIILIALLATTYGILWVGYYNKIIYAPFFRRGNWMMIFIYAVLLTFFMQMYGGFKVGFLKSGNLIYSQILAVVFANAITYFQIAVQDKKFTTPMPLILLVLGDAVLITVWSLVFQWLYSRMFPPRKMLLVTGDRRDYHLREKMNSREDKYEIVKSVSYRKGIVEIEALIQQYDGVIVGDMPSHERNQIIKYCYQNRKRSYSVPKISDILLRSSDELNMFDSPLLLSRNNGLSIDQRALKRGEDIVMALLMLLLFLPIFLIAWIGIKCTDSGPVFFKQDRLTQDGKIFKIYKFRTMVMDAEKDSGPVMSTKHDPRILPIGRFLRATRMDELPQIINILKGEMSVVGPRPERPELAAEIAKSIPEFDYRLQVKAGLTGYAQVYGKYNTTFYDKLKLDLTYIRTYSIFLDLKLILMTPKIMFMKESTEGVAEIEDILGKS